MKHVGLLFRKNVKKKIKMSSFKIKTKKKIENLL